MNNTILNMNKKADELYEKNNRYYTIITKLETESALVKTQNEELKAEVDSLKQLVDCYDIDPEDEQMVTFPHPKASFTSTRTRELNRLSAPSYLNNTQLSKKKKKAGGSKVSSMLNTQSQPVSNPAKANTKAQNGECTKVKSNDKKMVNGMSPGQYFSNSSSMGNTNGYYIKNSVREKGARMRLKKKGTNSLSSSNENKSNFLKGQLGHDSSPAQSIFKGAQKRAKNISML